MVQQLVVEIVSQYQDCPEPILEDSQNADIYQTPLIDGNHDFQLVHEHLTNENVLINEHCQNFEKDWIKRCRVLKQHVKNHRVKLSKIMLYRETPFHKRAHALKQKPF